MQDQDRPLIVMAELRAEEIRKRCEAAEDAARAIGFEPDTGPDLIVRLVARIAGDGALVRTVAEIADEVGISYSYALRCIAELQEHELLLVGAVDLVPTKRRGRPARTMQVWLNWELIRSTNEEYRRFVALQKSAKIPTQKRAAELVTGECRDDDELMTGGLRDDDELMTGGCPEQKHTVLENPIHPSPPPVSISTVEDQAATAEESSNCESADQPSTNQPSTFATIVDEIRDAGVERVRQLIAEAERVGMTPAELSDAAYVVRYTPSLRGGALFDHVRSGGWPIGGVKPADVIRDSRRQRAAEIRAETLSRAPAGTEEKAIAGVAAKRLLAAGLAEQIQAHERRAYDAKCERQGASRQS